MTTTALPQPLITPRSDPNDDVTHLWCCDPNLAMCGEDVSDSPEVDDGVGQDCVVCVDLSGTTFCDCPHPAP
ncbi:hypothetical protein ACFYO9_37510 [Streptomyces sp. NPDC005863]|uniref:hypothetical protein n=1 Tax=Streptomyces sp. NPDC005863 TaxID=3364735 RepID=UPI0036D09A75